MSHPPASTAPETATPQTAAPEAGTPTTPSPVDPVISVVVAATRDLNDAAAAQLLHWCEARLHLLDAGQSGISHLMLDLSRARRATTSAVAILDHARDEAARRHVGIHLVGAGPIMAACALPSATVSAGGAPIRPSMPRGPRWIHQQVQIVPAAVPSIPTRSCSHRSPRTIVSDSGDLHTDTDTSLDNSGEPLHVRCDSRRRLAPGPPTPCGLRPADLA